MADLITVPIRFFKIPASFRSDEDVLALLNGADAIWAQAVIALAIEGAVTTLPYDLTRVLGDVFDDNDGGAIAGFAIRAHPRGANGEANCDTRRFVVADSTTVPAERVCAHELGHILGLDHVKPPDPNRLMTKGGTGTELTAAEIRTARENAASL